MSWKLWRPVIWLTLIGVGLGVLVNPYVGVLVLGGALGVAAKIARSRP